MRRKIVLAMAAAALLLAALAGLLLVVGGKSDGPTDEVRAYLAAWERSDWPAMGALGDEPGATFAETHQFVTRDLRAERIRVRAGRIRRDGDRATAAFAADVTLSGVGSWRYEGRLPLTRVDGEWRVRWSPAAVHPSLQDGERLARSREWQPRAAILAADGTPLTTEGPVVAIGVEPRRVQDVEAVAAALAQHVGVDAERVRTTLTRPGLRPDVFVPFIDLREERFAGVRPALQPVPGVIFRRTTARLTPAEGFARHPVGRAR